ncbi:ABC transporter ATP-binding protein [Conexibacter sp. CPCC 206217]|uniref:ABC transporter ATP-binding protein n=1 Tax=Conexibacter sp. CPCC 206217 TaxID=3064574 RepID=UPI00271CBACF|nr:ABC transporter ATP-binding protein [Conexibacter sp. CPCC 206217]MDO8210099.1 ABC transporter ATP-binding protein [Conexibacter sp. CPCC 206217]
MLALEDVVLRYGRVEAVRGVSLNVEHGELVGLIGPNGAGKSTTLAAIMGFLNAASGSIELDGRSLTGTGPERVARLGVALVPEGRHIFPTLTVGENLRLGATVRSDVDAVTADCDALQDRFPVIRRAWRRRAGGLSGGEQQQLAIARALLSNPRLLLLDEPTLGLAPLMVDAIFDVLGELREEGMTILLVEQNAIRTAGLADRTYVLRSGRIALQGTRAELADRPDLASLYLGL